MNVHQPNASPTTLVVDRLMEVKVGPDAPLRTLLIGQCGDRRVAFFGYFDALQCWHCCIVPSEFRSDTMLDLLMRQLERHMGATLMTVPGDTINISRRPRPT